MRSGTARIQCVSDFEKGVICGVLPATIAGQRLLDLMLARSIETDLFEHMRVFYLNFASHAQVFPHNFG